MWADTLVAAPIQCRGPQRVEPNLTMSDTVLCPETLSSSSGFEWFLRATIIQLCTIDYLSVPSPERASNTNEPR